MHDAYISISLNVPEYKIGGEIYNKNIGWSETKIFSCWGEL